MAATVDPRMNNGFSGAGVQPVSQPSTVVADQYGGWMKRPLRAAIFGGFAGAWVLGAFLPGIILTARNWESIRGTCGDNIALRSLVVSCVFIGHWLLVAPMFIKGDRAQAVVQNGLLSSFWQSRISWTAAVLQVVGNLIELALLTWAAVGFWHDGDSGHANNNACYNGYREQCHYMWAQLIIGFVTVALSLSTIRPQYTSCALRDSYATNQYAKGQNNMMMAP